jgi:hypothetical protein
MGCRIEERMISIDGRLIHEICLSCRHPHIDQDVRRLELAEQHGQSWPHR